MPFGLVNAPACFQRVVNRIADEMERGEILVYLDDVIIPSKTVAEGLYRINKFLQLPQKYGLTLRLDKCNFLQSEIIYLGHVVNGNGIKPGEHKISAIKNFNQRNRNPTFLRTNWIFPKIRSGIFVNFKTAYKAFT